MGSSERSSFFSASLGVSVLVWGGGGWRRSWGGGGVWGRGRPLWTLRGGGGGGLGPFGPGDRHVVAFV